MPRGNNNNNNNRGRGGRGNGRGRGRGGGTPVRGGAPARGPRHQYAHTNAEFDFVIQEWVEEPPDAGRNMNRGRGSWGGGTPKSGAATSSRGIDSSRRGDSTPGRGRGRGPRRGRGGDPFYGPRRPPVGFGAKGAVRGNVLGKDAPLSALWSAERPLLRPVKFVRATLTPFLFQDSEELLEATPESADTTEASHVPTADRVARLFRGTTSDSDSDGNASDALEEIDFADLAKVREEVDAIAEASKRQDARPEEEMEEVDFADLAKIRAEVDAAHARVSSQDTVIEETFTGVYNLPKDANPTSSAMDVVDVDQQDSVQLSTAQSVPIISNDERLESIDAPKDSTDGSLAEAQDVIIVEEETNETPTGPSEMLRDEIPSLPETQAITHPDVAITTQEVSLPASNPPPTTSPQADAPSADDSPPLFVIDTAPSRPFSKRSTSDVILVDRTGRGETLGEEDELIVYVAPHPRSGRASPMPIPRVKLPNTSILSGKYSVQAPADVSGLRSPIREDELGEGAGSAIIQPREHDRTTRNEEDSLSLLLPDLEISPANGRQRQSKAALKAHKKEARLHRARQRNTKRQRSGFGSFGAMMSEAMLREDDELERRLPKWETRRRGDSDIDWGTEEEEEDDRVAGMGVGDDGVDEISNGLGGMDLDPELELDADAMKGFLKSMSAEGSRFVTADDIADEAKMRKEDEEGLGGPMGSSESEGSDEEDEEEAVFNVEERIMIAESGGVEDEDDDDELSEDSDDSDDDERLSPNSGFGARLRRLRERSRGQRPTEMQDISDEDENEEDLPEPRPFTRGADDEAFIARIEDMLEENSAILSRRDRKKRNALFRNLHQGYVDEYDIEAYLDDSEFTTPVKSKKGKKGKPKHHGATGIFEAKLAAQWEKDRAKKADYKRQREAARVAAAALDYAPIDLPSLESQLRRFVADIGGRSSLALPPMDKSSRKEVHELAAAFGLKSHSKGKDGKGKGRYTIVTKTTRTGVRMINEGKVKAVVRGDGTTGRREWERGGKVPARMPRHKEGDEVGKEAPKIGESNIGFKMLASMGWSEGDRIGGTGSVGIEAPLTAIIKNSKLGLGATR